jgi:uncharacterized protein (DUF2147 family)
MSFDFHFGLCLSAVLIGLVAPLSAAAQSQAASPVGLWRTIDDATQQPKALVRIVEQGGVLAGRIEKLLAYKPDVLCEQCTDERRGKPVQGMTILSGLKPEGGEWTGGEVLDPVTGKVYRARIKLADAGRKLEMRGYVGVPTLGRTQVWLREP